jgi:hypothetical protein
MSWLFCIPNGNSSMSGLSVNVPRGHIVVEDYNIVYRPGAVLPPSPSPSSSSTSVGVIAAASIGGIVGLAAVAFVCRCWYKRRLADTSTSYTYMVGHNEGGASSHAAVAVSVPIADPQQTDNGHTA